MELEEALAKIFYSSVSKDELINPFKLYSHLSDYCSSSFKEKEDVKTYIYIIERVNLMYFLLSYEKGNAVYEMKEGFGRLKGVSEEDYKRFCLATLHLKYSDSELTPPEDDEIKALSDSLLNYVKEDIKKRKKKVKIEEGQLLYYIPGSNTYHCSPYCPALKKAKNIMVKVNKKTAKLDHICRCCKDTNPHYYKIRLTPFDRLYALMKNGIRDSDIYIRRNGRDLKNKMIRNQMTGRIKF